MDYSKVRPIPVQSPTVSYWQDPPHSRLANYTSESFPNDVDTVIIGSGLTGALIAHNLLRRDHGRQGKSVLMLEARTASSGATGRNGGHIKPDCYRGFLSYQALHGSEVARQQCEFERANKEELADFIKKEGLEQFVDLVELRSCDVYMNPERWVTAKSSFDAFKAAGGNVQDIDVLEADAACQASRINGCYGAISFPACSLWPYKLVTALLERSLEKGLVFHTNTGVESVTEPSAGRRWAISTSKGVISCDQVFHATNGYATTLVPELAQHLLPLKGVVAAIDPSAAYEAQPFETSHGIHWGTDFDYMIQRPTDGKPVILGGGDLHHPQGVFAHVGNFDDSSVPPEVVDALVQMPSKHFLGWGPRGSLRRAWSGIMGITSDQLPLVGELPGKTGQFISVGFNGHGMARAYLTVEALCQKIYGEEVDPRCPPVYFELERRLRDGPSFDQLLEMLSESV